MNARFWQFGETNKMLLQIGNYIPGPETLVVRTFLTYYKHPLRLFLLEKRLVFCIIEYI